jgi:hypothetical protein
MSKKKVTEENTNIQLAKANEILNSVISELGDLYDKIEMDQCNGGELHQVITDLYTVRRELDCARDVEYEHVNQEHFYNEEKAEEDGWFLCHDDGSYYPVATSGHGETPCSISFNIFVAANKAMAAHNLSDNNVRAMRFLKEYSPYHIQELLEDATERFSELAEHFPVLIGEC